MNTPSNRGTHPLNVSYLVVGLIFLGIAGSWALREAGVVDLPEMRWLFPLTLVLAGLVGVAAMAAKGLSRGKAEQPQPTGAESYGDLGHDATGYDTPDDTQHHDDEGEAR